MKQVVNISTDCSISRSKITPHIDDKMEQSKYSFAWIAYVRIQKDVDLCTLLAATCIRELRRKET